MTVFVIAMESEAAAVLENMQTEKSYICCDKKIVCGKLCGRQTAAVICGVGKVNAACGAQYAIDVLGADKIINIGVAGGLNGQTQVCGIYAISHAVQYDFDLVQLNGTKRGTLDECAEPYIPLRTAGTYPLRRIGSGDRFNDDPADYALLTKELGADIRDMECAAIAQACMHAGAELYAFKAISDVAGSGSTTEQFMKNLKACNGALKAAVPAIFEGVCNA